MRRTRLSLAAGVFFLATAGTASAADKALEQIQIQLNQIRLQLDAIQTQTGNSHGFPTWDRVLPAADRFKLVMDGAAVLDKRDGAGLAALGVRDNGAGNLGVGSIRLTGYYPTHYIRARARGCHIDGRHRLHIGGFELRSSRRCDEQRPHSGAAAKLLWRARLSSPSVRPRRDGLTTS